MLTDAARRAIDRLLTELPKLHFWDDEWQVGGMNRAIGETIAGVLGAPGEGSPRIIESGAGISSLLFLAGGARRLVSIAPDADLGERITKEAAVRDIATAPLEYMNERSEIALPKLLAAGHSFDLALIDGAHGWPTVFVDFCYVNAMLRPGGTLLVDDIQLYSVRQLLLLLAGQDGFEVEKVVGKLAVVRRMGTRRFLPEWTDQPFIVANTLLPPAG